ncbi:NUDIX domain-containing protein [Microbulbifer elongatus]|uniref:NUDIX domain-containing protein n=1 Tax=Microbulbifer elongatus TaxID=86173 RepID=UPI001E532C84|nr:NUDIX domain-containing protein [Microbulbifer elongatus]
MSDAVRNLKSQVLSSDWSRFEKYTFEFKNPEGQWEVLQREVYDRGDGAVVLLYNPERRTVVLTRQFRLPTFLNGNKSGLMIEACAGALEGEDPTLCVIREAREETGYRISQLEKVFEVYMSPGSVTEKLHFYLARYSEEDRLTRGGGLDAEQEYIEVLETPFEQAFSMIGSGGICDAKTIMLLQHLKISRLLEA